MTGRRTPPDLFENLLFDHLDDGRRRCVLACLIGRSGPIELNEVAELLSVALGSGTSADGPDDCDRLAIELHHVHLPKLAAAGLLEYEPEGRTVRVNETVERVKPYLDLDYRYPADG